VRELQGELSRWPATYYSKGGKEQLLYGTVLLLSLQFRAALHFLHKDDMARALRGDAVHLAIALQVRVFFGGGGAGRRLRGRGGWMEQGLVGRWGAFAFPRPEDAAAPGAPEQSAHRSWPTPVPVPRAAAALSRPASNRVVPLPLQHHGLMDAGDEADTGVDPGQVVMNFGRRCAAAGSAAAAGAAEWRRLLRFLDGALPPGPPPALPPCLP
jgi:hypothetical protein